MRNEKKYMCIITLFSCKYWPLLLLIPQGGFSVVFADLIKKKKISDSKLALKLACTFSNLFTYINSPLNWSFNPIPWTVFTQ